MGLLFDEVVEDLKHDPHMQRLLQRFDFTVQTTVIRADNVAEYFYEGNDQEFWMWREDYPNVAPPFDLFWVEWKQPERVVSREKGTHEREVWWPQRVGVWVHSRRARASDRDLPFDVPGAKDWLGSHFDELHWLMEAQVWIKWQEAPIRLPVTAFIPVDADGRIVAGDDGHGHIRFLGADDPGLQFASPEGSLNPEERREFLHMATSQQMHVPLLTLCWLNSKNVSRELYDPDTVMPKVQQKRRKHGKRPLTKYYTLKVMPMRKTTGRCVPQRGEGGSPKAQHIRRGHFKQYGPKYGKGLLFGKYEGLWFWDWRLEGDPEAGEIRKDYEVLPPPR